MLLRIICINIVIWIIRQQYNGSDLGHGDYGKVYMKDGQDFFNLNFQVRIC